MSVERCFAALGFQERPKSREALDAVYEQLQAGNRSATESDKLAARLLEENYRACVRLMEENTE